MARRAREWSEAKVRVDFEATRLSERVLVQAYEQVTPIRRHRWRSGLSATDETTKHADVRTTPIRG